MPDDIHQYVEYFRLDLLRCAGTPQLKELDIELVFPNV